MKKFFYLLSIILLCACNQNKNSQTTTLVPFDTLNVNYSKGFAVYYYDDYKSIEIYNPWVENEIQQRLYLVKDKSIETPTDGQKIVVPIRNIAISSSTHTEFLQLLGEINSVRGLCTPHLIYNENIRANYANGNIIPLGDAHNVNIEKLIHLQPDAYFVASYNQQDEQAKRLQQSGVNLVYNNEWTEQTLLARAEWIKFMALFFDKEQLADSLFLKIENDYLAASSIAQSVKLKPSVLAGGNFKGTWYMPTGSSYMGRLFADAGADYFYKNDSSSSASLALNFETVLGNFHNADIWLNAPTTTLDALMQMDERHNLFRAAREGRVYGFYNRTLPDGANDFWESAVARPDLVLKDLIWALHPQLLPDYEPIYIMKLQ